MSPPVTAAPVSILRRTAGPLTDRSSQRNRAQPVSAVRPPVRHCCRAAGRARPVRKEHSMTRTDKPTATTDYQTTIRVKASPDALFDALTTPTGLAEWWNPAGGSGETGGELRFVMNAPEPLVIHVDEATRPTSVQWTVTECPFLPDWLGTQPTFTIKPVDGSTSELHFHHRGL